MDILEGLNNEQQEAVTHTSGPLLIIAGAGTGKTTVVTRRIAHLINEGIVEADEILALTFTDKAAGEMEERVEALLPSGYVDLWVSTFHGFGDRILREHALDVGLSNDYRLLSDTEQWLLLREHIDELELDYYKPKGNPTKFIQALVSHFSRLKDEDITPEQYLEFAEGLQLDLDSDGLVSKKGLSDEEKAKVDEAQRIMEVAKAYMHYQNLLRQNNAMDFGDLIVETIHLFQERPQLLEKYRQQFKYILVDEFQDTNYAQYDLIRLLAAPNNNLTVVADDDQSIYRFRGASTSNILEFKEDYPDSKNVSLVQNYRSVQAILDLSYEFIKHNNPDRLEEKLGIDKRLQSNKEGDGIVEHLHSQSLEGEVNLVIDKIIEIKNNEPDTSWSDIAILVRANDSANTFIPVLERVGIPYQFMASQGLFAKPIILDVISFLKLLDNYHESRAMYRVLTYDIWNIPHEDIVKILEYGRKHTQSIYETCKEIRAVTSLNESTYASVDDLLGHIGRMTEMARYKTVGEVVLKALEQTGYLQHVTEKEDQEAAENVLYLNQFYKYIEAFEQSHAEKTVRSFILELVAMIEAGEQGRLQPDYDDGPDAVRIMTVHASKGLEFEHVFIANLVDKRFPAIGRREAIPVPEAVMKETLPEGDWHLQEERRLFYVALTRAKRSVYLCSGEDYGGARKKKPSRFLVEAGFVDTEPQPTGEVLFGKEGESKQAPQQEAAQSKGEVLEHKPTTLSFTQLKAYESCPWQYRFAFLLRVPVPGKPSFSFGKTIHNTLYEFFRRMKESEDLSQGGLFDEADSNSEPAQPLTLDTMLEIYEEKWIAEWYTTKTQREEYYKKGKDLLKQFYELHVGNWPRVAELESGFSLPIGDYKLKGAIDRVDFVQTAEESEDGNAQVKVIDYKTGNFPKSGKKDMEQLYIYAMALQEVFKMNPLKLSYYFVEDNKEIQEDFDPAKLEKVTNWVLETAESLMSGDFTAKPGFQCKYCDFKEICEFKK